MKKKFLLSILLSAVAVFVLNGAIYPLFYMDFLRNNSGLTKELFDKMQKPVAQTEIVATILSILFIGTLVTTVIYWARARTFARGLIYGSIRSEEHTSELQSQR